MPVARWCQLYTPSPPADSDRRYSTKLSETTEPETLRADWPVGLYVFSAKWPDGIIRVVAEGSDGKLWGQYVNDLGWPDGEVSVLGLTPDDSDYGYVFFPTFRTADAAYDAANKRVEGREARLAISPKSAGGFSTSLTRKR